MRKQQFNEKFREYARELTPDEAKRNFVAKIYESFRPVLGPNCFQIGSYPRFTAITPLHDLDILYVLGSWNPNSQSPKDVLDKLHAQIKGEYKNPTGLATNIKKQTHSVTVSYSNSTEIVFSVDIVPAFTFFRNEFGDDKFMVPEIVRVKAGAPRMKFYESLQEQHMNMGWVHTDPKGYIEIAKRTNKQNSDFRKSVKVIKSWKGNLKMKDKNLALKSFHLEQVIAQQFQNNNNWEIFDSVFNFFYELPNIIERPQILDRADSSRYIDEYLNGLTDEQKGKIKQARDCALVKLENADEYTSAKSILEPCFYNRAASEKFLFDDAIPVLTECDESTFQIDGDIKKRGGFRHGWLSAFSNKVAKESEIYFQIRKGEGVVRDYTLWKVQNDKNSSEVLGDDCVRGEISKDSTRNVPESTQYKGNHYVECFAIKNNKCIARSKSNVIIT